MRTDDAPESGNVEDRRGMKKAGIAAGGGGIILVIIALLTGVDLRGKLPVGGGGGGGDPEKVDPKPLAFAKKVLGMTETVWDEQFRAMGKRYVKPKMVLFSDGVETGGCGSAPSAVGPFYCPADSTLYLDPTFFDELETKLGGSKAEFSQAYVIAHEVGHHVQNLLEFSDKTNEKRGKKQENEYSIRLELQADYLAGVWAHHANKKYKILEPGDADEALKSARSIGDDRLQKRSGFNSPEKYNHGTSKQREKFFSEGMTTGDATLAKLRMFFDEQKMPFDGRIGELIDRR
jgi:uncharacterized protein